MIQPSPNTREPHLAYGDPEAVLKEIAHVAWGLGVHAGIIQDYVVLGHRDGIGLATKDARACMVQLIGLVKELLHDA